MFVSIFHLSFSNLNVMDKTNNFSIYGVFGGIHHEDSWNILVTTLYNFSSIIINFLVSEISLPHMIMFPVWLLFSISFLKTSIFDFGFVPTSFLVSMLILFSVFFFNFHSHMLCYLFGLNFSLIFCSVLSQYVFPLSLLNSVLVTCNVDSW